MDMKFPEVPITQERNETRQGWKENNSGMLPRNQENEMAFCYKRFTYAFFFYEWLNFHASALGNLGDTRMGDLIYDHKRIFF